MDKRWSYMDDDIRAALAALDAHENTGGDDGAGH
jgi:hypothetical protein